MMTTKQIDVRYINTNMGEPVATVDFNDFKPGDQAFATSRCLAESDDHWAAAEYIEPGTIVIDDEERPAHRVYLFTNADMTDDAGEPRQEEDYAWNAEHCARILLAD